MARSGAASDQDWSSGFFLHVLHQSYQMPPQMIISTSRRCTLTKHNTVCQHRTPSKRTTTTLHRRRNRHLHVSCTKVLGWFSRAPFPPLVPAEGTGAREGKGKFPPASRSRESPRQVQEVALGCWVSRRSRCSVLNAAGSARQWGGPTRPDPRGPRGVWLALGSARLGSPPPRRAAALGALGSAAAGGGGLRSPAPGPGARATRLRPATRSEALRPVSMASTRLPSLRLPSYRMQHKTERTRSQNKK